LNRRFIHEYLMLLIGGVTLQIAATTYRLVLARQMGPEPLGLVGMVFPFYRFLCVLATLGLLPNLTRLAAIRHPSGEGPLTTEETIYHKIIFHGSLILGFILAATASWLGRTLFPDPRVSPLFMISAPALPLTAIIWSRRASLQGMGLNWPLITSEWGEQAAEAILVLSLLFTCHFSPFGSAKLLMFGFLLGEIISIGLLNPSWHPHVSNRISADPANKLQVRSGLWSSLPILLHQFLASASGMTEGWLIPRRLIIAGMSAADATSAVGELWGMVMPVVFAPLMIVTPLSTLVLPRSARWRRNDPGIKRRLIFLFIFLIILGTLSSILIVTLAQFLSSKLFGNVHPVFGIRLLAPIIPFAFVSIVGGTILQGYGAYRTSAAITFITVITRTALIYLLTGSPVFRLHGAIFAMGFSQALTAALTLTAVFSSNFSQALRGRIFRSKPLQGESQPA
jgi:stage V sporulation protein B